MDAPPTDSANAPPTTPITSPRALNAPLTPGRMEPIALPTGGKTSQTLAVLLTSFMSSLEERPVTESDLDTVALAYKHTVDFAYWCGATLQNGGRTPPPTNTGASLATPPTAPPPKPTTTSVPDGSVPQGSAPKAHKTTTTSATGHRTQPATGKPAAPAAAPHPRSTQPRKARRSQGPSTRLVVSFADTRTLASRPRPHPLALVSALNDAARGKYVGSVDYSGNGQLVLHTQEPHTAEQLAVHGDTLWPVIRNAFGLQGNVEPPTFETDTEWAKVVIHRTPLPVWDASKTAAAIHDELLAELCTNNNLNRSQIKRVRWLCSEDEAQRRYKTSTVKNPQFVSVMLALSGESAARNLRKRGVNWQGAHCRVSDYQARRRV